jgi:choline-sulfatase
MPDGDRGNGGDRPNVLFLLSDEHSFRFFGHRERERGGEPVETPAFDDLAASSAVFDRAYCAMPLCTPSRLTTLTGREVRGSGAWRNNSVLRDQPTVASSFSAAGYETCLVGKMHLGGDRQFAGFDRRPYGDLTGGTGHQWDPPVPDQSKGRETRSRTADAGVTAIPESHLQEYNVTRETLAFVREQAAERGSDDPWFCCASLSRPHFPLTAPRRYVERYLDDVPEPFVGDGGDAADHPMTVGAKEGFRTGEIDAEERRRARACYFACVDFLDDIVGEFLATMEREGHLENTVVVYTTDHGELAGEHGLWWKHTWHEASARVPLFVQTPAHRRGERAAARLETPVSLLDLYPTLCGLAGVEAPDEVDGVDLAPSVREGTEPDRGPVVCDNLVPRWGEGTEFRAVVDGDYKYIGFRDAPELLFDLAADPDEQTNLAAADPDGEAAAALDRLRAFVSETMDFEAAERERERDAARAAERELDAPTGTGNAYHLPDGRVVDADVPLYRPRVLAERPDRTFDDYPGSGEGD